MAPNASCRECPANRPILSNIARWVSAHCSYTIGSNSARSRGESKCVQTCLPFTHASVLVTRLLTGSMKQTQVGCSRPGSLCSASRILFIQLFLCTTQVHRSG